MPGLGGSRRDRWRPTLALVAWSSLLALLLWSASPKELQRRWRFFRHYAAESLETRRLAGTATAFDRDYFVFLDSVRGSLPASAEGVALFGQERSNRAYYLAVYCLAPSPVLPSPPRVPSRWVAAVYGAERPPGWRIVASVFHGTIFEPRP
jgi:hypothetical protein